MAETQPPAMRMPKKRAQGRQSDKETGRATGVKTRNVAQFLHKKRELPNY
jgi:hypothetical protein